MMLEKEGNEHERWGAAGSFSNQQGRLSILNIQ